MQFCLKKNDTFKSIHRNTIISKFTRVEDDQVLLRVRGEEAENLDPDPLQLIPGAGVRV